MSDIKKCLWKDPISRQVELYGIEGQTLNVRECYYCDGFQSICDRYFKGKVNDEDITGTKSIVDGMRENYLK